MSGQFKHCRRRLRRNLNISNASFEHLNSTKTEPFSKRFFQTVFIAIFTFDSPKNDLAVLQRLL
jgi:hypothetical protein